MASARNQAGVASSREDDRAPVYYAIGDIHGRRDCLDALLARIVRHGARADERDVRARVIVTLGDYVDRGPDSRGVIERLMRGVEGFSLVTLKGNHEAIFLTVLADPAPDLWAWWRRNGGHSTLSSYGRLPEGPPTRAWLEDHVPEAHRRWLEALPVVHAPDGLVFVHAGIRPGVPLDAQSEEDMLWIRQEFLDSRVDFGGRIVHGHTPNETPEILANRINLDTLAYASGILTCAVIDGTDPRGTPEILQTSL
ncbi:MAG: serine/threonine protein phosphatase [Alphaproteobacteria bacterium]|nr:serine/threonine protein phosphatase [Alphaproteobacteria bacterium]